MEKRVLNLGRRRGIFSWRFGLAVAGLLSAAIPAVAQQQYFVFPPGASRPSVIVDLSVLEKLGPEPTLPGMLRSGRTPLAPAATGKLLPPPSEPPKSQISLPKGLATRAAPAPRRAPVTPSVAPKRPVVAAAPSAPRKTVVPPAPAIPKRATQTARPPVAAPVPPKVATPAPKKATAPTIKPPIAPKRQVAPPPPIVRVPAKPATVPPPPVLPKASPPRAKAVPPPPKAKPAPPVRPTVPPPPKRPRPATASKPLPKPSVPPPPAAKKSKPVQVAARTPPTNTTSDGTIRVGFNAGSSDLPSSAAGALDKLVAQMSGNPDIRVQLHGYANGSSESPSQARRMSLFRALAVRTYLMKKGVRSTRIDVRALGKKDDGQIADRVDVIIPKS